MYQLVRLGNCVQVFDNQNSRFVKSSAGNVANALGYYGKSLTHKQMIAEAQWARCSDPRCHFRCCRDGGHWIALKS